MRISPKDPISKIIGVSENRKFRGENYQRSVMNVDLCGSFLPGARHFSEFL